jgi:hypothetical protein
VSFTRPRPGSPTSSSTSRMMTTRSLKATTSPGCR